MPDYQKDTPRQAALRREIETHAICCLLYTSDAADD